MPKYIGDIDTAFPFCGDTESKNHLLFACPFSSQVWGKVYAAIGKSRLVLFGWDSFLSWALATLKRNTSLNLVMKLGVSSFIYHI